MKSKTGLIGIGILSSLVIVSLIAATTIPIDTFKQWNNPNSWISYPKAAMPIWVNYFLEDKIPEHIIIENPSTMTKKDVISVTSFLVIADGFSIIICSGILSSRK